ncbi:unnamed protein product [Peniophora sp. CBMAI 1063]|nr:unnamed protein product [Peniophora sp. CBMAI 1063]
MSAARLAGEPFNSEDADFVIRSSDMVDFKVHKVLLKQFFQSFDEMLGAPMVGGVDAQNAIYGLPLMDSTESSEALGHLLRLLYPVPYPDLSADWPALLSVLTLMDKYIAKFYPLSISSALLRAAKLPDGPGLGAVFVLASRHPSLNEVLEEVARLSLREVTRLDDVPKDLLRGMSATQYHALIDYQNRCHQTAVDAATAENLVEWIPTAEFPGGLSGSGCSCLKVAELRGFDWDVGGDDEPVLYKVDWPGDLVLWMSDYLDAVKRALKTNISGRAASNSATVKCAITEAMKCSTCSKTQIVLMIGFVDKLATHLDEKINAVPFHLA